MRKRKAVAEPNPVDVAPVDSPAVVQQSQPAAVHANVSAPSSEKLSIDSILDQLDRFHQRATYGAVALVVGSSARSLMSGRTRDAKSSWIVSQKDGLPTGYAADQVHSEIHARAEILNNVDHLRIWLQNPV